MEKLIKEIYGWDLIEKPETNLLKHINRILNKKVSELDSSDVGLMLRQEVFLDIAIPKAIEFIKENPSVGEYDFQLLKNLSELSNLDNYKIIIDDLILKLENKKNNIIFELEDDKVDFENSLKILKNIH